VTWEQRKTGRRVTHLTFIFSEKTLVTSKKPKKVSAKATAKPAEVKIDNIEYFADMRKKYGDNCNIGISEEIKTILKAQGRW
jgi:hypothetical protein